MRQWLQVKPPPQSRPCRFPHYSLPADDRFPTRMYGPSAGSSPRIPPHFFFFEPFEEEDLFTEGLCCATFGWSWTTRFAWVCGLGL